MYQPSFLAEPSTLPAGPDPGQQVYSTVCHTEYIKLSRWDVAMRNTSDGNVSLIVSSLLSAMDKFANSFSKEWKMGSPQSKTSWPYDVIVFVI